MNAYREPKIQKYIVRNDCYELTSLQDLGQFIMVQIKVGKANVMSNLAEINLKKKDNKQKKENSEVIY